MIILGGGRSARGRRAANLRTKIPDFGGFHSSRIFILRDGLLVSIGNFLESLSQAILVGTILAGRLGVGIILVEIILAALIFRSSESRNLSRDNLSREIGP